MTNETPERGGSGYGIEVSMPASYEPWASPDSRRAVAREIMVKALTR
jgi:hypothetical protein